MKVRSAMILAAGRGERLRPVTDKMPKPLIPIAGRSMLERTIDRLVEHGVSNIVVNVHHLGEQIVKRVGDRVRIVHERRLLGTGGSVKNALTLLGYGPFFVINGDGLWREGPGYPMLGRMEGYWNPARIDALLLLQPIHKVIGREATVDRGDYFLEPGGHLRHRGVAMLTPFAFASVSLCDERLFQDSPDGPFSLLDLWHRAEARRRLFGIVHEGDWFHIGTPKALAEAERILA